VTNNQSFCVLDKHCRQNLASSQNARIPDLPQLPTPALDRHDTAAVWVLRLHGEPGAPTSITDSARFVLTIFYIDVTFLSGHTPTGETNLPTVSSMAYLS